MELLPCFCCLTPVVFGLAFLAYLPILRKKRETPPTENQ